MYRKYLDDPNSVDEAWRRYFEQKESGATSNGHSSSLNVNIDDLAERIASRLGTTNVKGGASIADISASTRILSLVRSYQTVGHEKAQIDPLKLQETYGNILQIGKVKKTNVKRLDYRFHGFTEQQLDNEYHIDSPSHRGFLALKQNWKLRDLIDSLEKAYCGTIGIEYMHIQSLEECNWIREKFEEGAYEEPTKKHQLQSYDRLCWSVLMGDFLQSKYNTQKRFGLEG